MSCKYCENMKSVMSDFEYGEGIASNHSRSVFAHIAKDPSTNKFYFEIDEDYQACFNIHFCPICGRKLAEEE